MLCAFELEEILGIVNDFCQVIVNVCEVGFDLVEFYFVYGYLLYQFFFFFLNYCIDQYGGSVENCVCLVLEVVDVGIEEWGVDCIGICVLLIGIFQNIDNGLNEEVDVLYLIE